MIAHLRAVFFDAGGTLFHPYPSVGEIYQETAARYGLKVRAEDLEKCFREAWLKKDGLSGLKSHSSEKIEREWWRALVQEVFSSTGGVRDFEKFFDELYDLFARPACWRLYPGAREVLRELKKRGKKLAIISNWDSRLFKLCEGLGVEEYFEFVLASAVFGASKPSPRIFEEALRKTGLDAREAVHIGDSFEDDVKGALGVGMEAILIHRGPSHERKLEGVRVIGDLKELL